MVFSFQIKVATPVVKHPSESRYLFSHLQLGNGNIINLSIQFFFVLTKQIIFSLQRKVKQRKSESAHASYRFSLTFTNIKTVSLPLCIAYVHDKTKSYSILILTNDILHHCIILSTIKCNNIFKIKCLKFSCMHLVGQSALNNNLRYKSSINCMDKLEAFICNLRLIAFSCSKHLQPFL